MNINLIRSCAERLKFSSHAKEEMLYEEYGVIHEYEVKEAIKNGEIIEKYLKDKPYPSFLVFGKTDRGRPLHIVCALVEEGKILVVVTVYQPDSALWVDYKRRRE